MKRTIRPKAYLVVSVSVVTLAAGLALGLKLGTGQSLTTSELFSPDHQNFHVQLSPDGTKSLVRRAIDGTRRIDVFEFAEDRFLDIHRENFTSAHWRLDSNSIYASTRKNLYVYDLVNRVSGQHSISPTNLKQWRVVRYPQTESQSLLVAARSSNRSRQRDIHRCSDLLGAAPRCETVVEGLPPHGVVVWDHGDNVVGRSAADDGGNIHWAYRSGGSGWLPAFHYPSDRIFTPLSPIDLNGEFLALSDRGRNFAAMVNVNLSTGEERVVYADPQKSLRWVYMSRDKRRPLVAKTSDPFGKFYYFDTAPKTLFERLRARYANPVWINIVDIDRRENRWLVTVQGLTLPQELFLLDVERDQIQQLAAASYSNRTAQFSNTVSIGIPAVDGREMPSYLTMPKDADQEPVPLIIRLHGGPWGRYLPILTGGLSCWLIADMRSWL